MVIWIRLFHERDKSLSCHYDPHFKVTIYSVYGSVISNLKPFGNDTSIFSYLKCYQSTTVYCKNVACTCTMAVGKMYCRNDKSFESKNITSLRLSETIGLEFKGFPGIDCIPYPNRKKR